MGCQKSIAFEIIKKKGDYVLGVKKNQPALHNDCVHYFEDYLNKNSKLSSRIGTSLQVRYFITSLSLNPEKTLSAVRQHWFVENQLHWVLDVTFGEDDSRIRRGDAAENMAVLRRLSLNICKRYANGDSNPKKLKKAAWDDSFREKLIFGIGL